MSSQEFAGDSNWSPSSTQFSASQPLDATSIDAKEKEGIQKMLDLQLLGILIKIITGSGTFPSLWYGADLLK